METVEVFKTNVSDARQARVLLLHLHQTFPTYKATFDLDDCDRILRVVCLTGDIQACLVIGFLKSLGYRAEVLPDEWVPVAGLCQAEAQR